MATETTPTSAAAWSPDVTGVAPEDAVPDALILLTSTVAGSVEGDAPAVRVMYVDDADATFVAEGDDIPEADPDLAECVVHTGKVSQLVRLSREQFSQPNAEELLSESVARAVTRTANAAYIAQAAPTSPAVTPPAGLLNVAGIEDGGAVADDLDALVDAFATIEGNDGAVSHIIASPTAWASLRKFKTGTGSAASLLGAGVADTTRSLLGVPVLVSPAVTAGALLAVDRTAVVSAVGQVMVSQSEHFYFGSDSLALRCTWRFGANLVHPERVAKLTVTAPTA